MVSILKKIYNSLFSSSKETEVQQEPALIQALESSSSPSNSEPKIKKETNRYILSADETLVTGAANYEQLVKSGVTPALGYVRQNEWMVIDKEDNKLKIVEVVRVGGLPVVIPKDIPTGK